MPQKKNPDSTATTKILALYTLLFFQPKAFSLGMLAEKLQCSKQTVLNLCTKLECFAAEFRTEIRGKERWYWFEQSAHKSTLGMAPQALNCLVFCKKLASHLLPEGMLREADEAIARSSTLLSDLSRCADAMDVPLGVRGKGFIDYSTRQEELSKLLEAAKKNRICRVLYKKSEEHEEREHVFLPGRIIAHHEALYVEGWAVTETAPYEVRYPMTLAMHRIQGVTTMGQMVGAKPTLPHQDAPKGFGVMDNQRFRAVIEFTARAAQYVRERIWSEDQMLVELSSGRLRLEFTAGDLDEVAAWVLSFGKEAIVAAPEALRMRVEQEIEEMISLYAK